MNVRCFAVVLALLVACGGDAPVAEPEQPPVGVVDLDPVQLRGLALVIDTVTLEQVAIPLDIPATVGTPDPATAHLGSIVEGRVVACRSCRATMFAPEHRW